MRVSPGNGKHVFQSINENFLDVCGNNYIKYDRYLPLLEQVVLDDIFDNAYKDIAIKMLRDIAVEKNRYNAQDLIKEKLIPSLKSQIVIDKLEEILADVCM